MEIDTNTLENAINCFHIGWYLVSLHAPFVTQSWTVSLGSDVGPWPRQSVYTRMSGAKYAHNTTSCTIRGTKPSPAPDRGETAQTTANGPALSKWTGIYSKWATYGCTYRSEWVQFGVRQWNWLCWCRGAAAERCAMRGSVRACACLVWNLCFQFEHGTCIHHTECNQLKTLENGFFHPMHSIYPFGAIRPST